MHKFKVGDSVLVVKKIGRWGLNYGLEESLWPQHNSWVDASMNQYIGNTYKIASVTRHGYSLDDDGITFPEGSLEFVEMNLEQWSKRSTADKLAYNTKALEALVNGEKIEFLQNLQWQETGNINGKYPHRPKVKEVMPDTVIKWVSFRDQKPLANQNCYILYNGIVREGFYSGMGSFHIGGGILTSEWWSPC